ncbi:MAG: hypothetical protein M1833_006560 [Piccolia ochrophora]|nr:MAG: hypothetical protein M1833_006560 [Piccolia ochrophora]
MASTEKPQADQNRTHDIPNASPTPAPELTNGSSCEFDPSANGQSNIDVNDKSPSSSVLKKAADLVVLAADGSSRPFKSLYSGEGVAQRVLVVFVRHFFCGNCQNYLRTLMEAITPDSLLSLPVPTFIAVVGCGKPNLIDLYVKETGCPFPVYADPSKKIFDLLGMSRTYAMGRKPEYLKGSMLYNGVASALQMIKAGPASFGGGEYKQNGGEFLFDKSKVTWCHRMRNTRDHTEVPELVKVLGLDKAAQDKAAQGNGVGSEAPKRRRSVNLGKLMNQKTRHSSETASNQENGTAKPETPKRRWSVNAGKLRNRMSGDWSHRANGSTKLAKEQPSSVKEEKVGGEESKPVVEATNVDQLDSPSSSAKEVKASSPQTARSTTDKDTVDPAKPAGFEKSNDPAFEDNANSTPTANPTTTDEKIVESAKSAGPATSDAGAADTDLQHDATESKLNGTVNGNISPERGPEASISKDSSGQDANGHASPTTEPGLSNGHV